jgi:uncharacterized protein YbjT (DUF2867 family)
MTDTVLVTGATGTTGSALVRELLAADADVAVRAGVHSLDSATDLPDGVDVVEMDQTDPDTLGPAFAGVDRAYLLTPFVPEQTPLVENLVDAATAAGVDHLVRHSALGAGSDDPAYSLAADHAAAERVVESAGIDYTHVRPTAFMQNLLGEAETIREQGAIYNPVGEPVAYVDARDVAGVAAAVLTGSGHAGEAYPVTGPEAVTWGDVADALAAELGRDVSHVQVSMDDARAGLADAGMPDPLVDGYVGLLQWFESGGGDEVYSTVEDLTGRPARSVREFVADHAAAFE